MKEWLKIPLNEVNKLHDSIPRQIEAVQKAAGGPTPILNELSLNLTSVAIILSTHCISLCVYKCSTLRVYQSSFISWHFRIVLQIVLLKQIIKHNFELCFKLLSWYWSNVDNYLSSNQAKKITINLFVLAEISLKKSNVDHVHDKYLIILE